MEIQEIWKDIPGYEGLYQVSNKGNVRIINYRKTGNSKLRKPFNKGGYLKVKLFKNGKYKNYSIHRLVCCIFNDEPLDIELTVNHKDGNPSNNNLENLELCTIQENIIHSFKTGLNKNKGINHTHSKLTEEQVKDIKEKIENGVKQSFLARQYQVDRTTIRDIKNNRTWKDI